MLYQRYYLELLVKYGLESPDQLEDTGAVVETAGEGLGLLGLGPLAPSCREPWSERAHPAA